MKPCKRKTFIRKVRKLGFTDPKQGGSHQAMFFGMQRLTLPSNTEFGTDQIMGLLKQVGMILNRKISDKEWETL